MEGLKAYKAQIFRKVGRRDLRPIDPLEKVVISEMRQDELAEYLRLQYSGFSVVVDPVEEIERVERPEKPVAPKEGDRYRTTWIRDCRISGGEVTPALAEAIATYGNVKAALDKCEEEVKAIVRAIELSKPLVREVNLTGIRIDPTRPIAVSGISIMLEGGYLENLGGGKEEKPL